MICICHRAWFQEYVLEINWCWNLKRVSISVTPYQNHFRRLDASCVSVFNGFAPRNVALSLVTSAKHLQDIILESLGIAQAKEYNTDAFLNPMLTL
jgi:hypothetical protein